MKWQLMVSWGRIRRGCRPITSSILRHILNPTTSSILRPAGLISRTFSANEQYFSLTTNPPTVPSAMAYQPSEQGIGTERVQHYHRGTEKCIICLISAWCNHWKSLGLGKITNWHDTHHLYLVCWIVCSPYHQFLCHNNQHNLETTWVPPHPGWVSI